jgi:ADP-heptose:LPS heptosyltransferase
LANLLATAGRLARLRVGRPHVQRANAHRDRAEWIEAVVDYRRALDWLPWREDLHIQIGNCLKEYGDYRAAVTAYSKVTAGAQRPEALKQMADTNRRARADILPYAIADRSELVPGADDGTTPAGPSARTLPDRILIDATEPRRWLGSLGRDDNHPVRVRGNNYPSIMFDQVGAMALVRGGAREPLLAGTIAIRARIFSLARIESVELWIGEGATAIRAAIAPVSFVERKRIPIRLHVANIWIDSATLPPGRHWLSIRAGSHAPSAGLFVNVAAAVANADAKTLAADVSGSDAFLPSPPPGTADLGAWIAGLPAQPRSAARSIFDKPIRSILAMRADQLGDVSASLPAVARLRTLFPDAAITLLVQPGVKAIVEASALAERVETIQLDYSAVTERRTLSTNEEARLRAVLAPEAFDLAIDLCPGDETRPLLLLTGATYLVGFNADRFTFLDFGIGVQSRDKVNRLDRISHAAAVMTLVEALAVAMAPSRPSVPRLAPSRAALDAQRLQAGGYAVLHTGARHPLNRWPLPNFLSVAERLLAETELAVVLFSDDPATKAHTALRENDRVRILDVIDPDAFDAIVSGARLLVGNDSGPKHLAAVRGVPTISLHVDRLNWSEWGQDGPGTILSKRVPCTGCGLNDIQLCGREAVCVRSIHIDEVMAAIRPLL